MTMKQKKMRREPVWKEGPGGIVYHLPGLDMSAA